MKVRRFGIRVSGLGFRDLRLGFHFGDYGMGCGLRVQGFGGLGISVSGVGLGWRA